MINVIIVLALAAAIIFMAKSSIKHFRGEGGCCGGGGGAIEDEKTLEGPEIGEKVVKIEGMSCENCRVRVQNAINRLDGVACHVDLKKSEALLHYSRDVDDSEIRQAVEGAGYKLA